MLHEITTDSSCKSHLETKHTTTLSVSFTEDISVKGLCEDMIGRFYLSSDRKHYTERDIPLAVLTVMVDGRNTGSKNPKAGFILLKYKSGKSE